MLVLRDKNHVALVIYLYHALIKLSLTRQVACKFCAVIAIVFIHDAKAKRLYIIYKVPEKHLFTAETADIAVKIQQIHIAVVPAYIVKLNKSSRLCEWRAALYQAGLGTHDDVITCHLKFNYIHVVQAVGRIDIFSNRLFHFHHHHKCNIEIARFLQ